MTKAQKISLFLLRISLGWLFFYAGVTKLVDPTWSAAGYLQTAKTFAGFYAWLASPAILPLTNFVNAWGLTIIGIAIMLGLFTRLVSWLGLAMMLLYYFPILQFPHPDAHSYIVDDHIMYSATFLVLGMMSTGKIWGLDAKLAAKFPKLRCLTG